ncbi:RNA 2',3'-cyclic phosphodiesterase [Pontibacter chitinilyticus]|uniref:RNA 2',3'-cyclic phosphodiesterase n=1 Tax=Pontibacter chitinilyticus TaxID=2674989 RepID=UPI0032193651
MKDSIRLFAAAMIPPAVKAQLLALQQSFQHPNIRFMPEQNLHLTLYFIGNVPLAQLPSIQEHIGQVVQQQRPFTLTLNCLETGPNSKAPRLVWARFQRNEAFELLSHQLAEALAPEPVKQQKAIPHITMARFRKDTLKPLALPPVYPDAPVELSVTAVGLWKSELASPHPVYSVLQSYAFS